MPLRHRATAALASTVRMGGAVGAKSAGMTGVTSALTARRKLPWLRKLLLQCSLSLPCSPQWLRKP